MVQETAFKSGLQAGQPLLQIVEQFGNLADGSEESQARIDVCEKATIPEI